MKGDDFPVKTHGFQGSGELTSEVIIIYPELYHILSIDSSLLTIINHH
jgi:hypothetical protein